MHNAQTSLAMVFESTAATRQALDAYDGFAQKARGWSVEEKLNLYHLASRAWDVTGSTKARSNAFGELMGRLRGYWQLNRPGGLMSDDDIYATLRPLEHVRRLGRASDSLEDALAPVLALRRVKKSVSRWYSPMALSKILHFFNPSIYPIYDTAVVEDRVLHRFRNDWREFDPTFTAISIPLHTGAIYYFKYMLWCEHLLSINRASVLQVFRNWIESQDIPLATAALAHGLDATAFEMIAIGAAHLQADATRGSSPP